MPIHATGAAVDTEVSQTSWNVDSFNGNGPSGITIDFTKTQILVIDFEWLGVGRVRVGFNLNGVNYTAHEFNNANSLAVAYMSTPNLPLRYEIENTGAGAASTIMHICGAVASEGGADLTGTTHYVSNQGTEIDCNTSGTIYALLGFRLKSTHLGAVIGFDKLETMSSTGVDYEWLLIHNPTVASALTFNGVANSAIEYGVGEASNPSLSTLTNGTILQGGLVASAAGPGGGGHEHSTASPNTLRLGSAIDGTRDEVYLAVRPFGTNANIQGAAIWRETF